MQTIISTFDLLCRHIIYGQWWMLKRNISGAKIWKKNIFVLFIFQKKKFGAYIYLYGIYIIIII